MIIILYNLLGDIMSLLKYILLAIIQGITEPLPISSSGHMTLFKTLFNTNMFNDLNFEIVCNFGSFLAILFLFRKEVITLIKDFLIFIFKKDQDKKKNFLYCIYIVISTIPVIITGVLFKDLIETKLSNIHFLGIAFLITAICLFLVKNVKGHKDDQDITLKDAIIIGLFEAIAIMPGISRSGAVLVACLLCKFKKETALKYTFILYFPVSLGAMVLGVKDLVTASNLSSLILPYSLGIVIAGIITLLSYQWLASWVKKGKLQYFAIYCLLLALFIFIYFR